MIKVPTTRDRWVMQQPGSVWQLHGCGYIIANKNGREKKELRLFIKVINPVSV